MNTMSKKKESSAKERTHVISEIGKYRGRIRKWELAKDAAQSLANKKERSRSQQNQYANLSSPYQNCSKLKNKGEMNK
jgi:hypothetical protein